MELYQMIYRRLRDDEVLSELTAKYNGRAAIFYQHPATPENAMWEGKIQYPRIDYTIDLMENPARNTSGVLTINIWCDTQVGAEPEDIEARVRDLLHATFAQADDYPYCFAWVRSDAFEAKVEKEQMTRTIGITTIFDIMACPSQYTMYPDPIKAMNDWTKKVLPDAVVIGHDEISGWVTPTREKPVVYWRLASIGIQQRHFTHTWLNANIEGHVYAKTAADRLYNLVKLNTAQALAGHIPMEDTSPLFLKDYSCKPHLNYLSQGQIQAQGRFGILQPESHFENRATGSKLMKTNIPREIIEEDGASAQVNGDTTRGFVFPYPQSDEDSKAGERPQANMVGGIAGASVSAEPNGSGYVYPYEEAGTLPDTNVAFANGNQSVDAEARLTPYSFPYPQSDEDSKAGERPQE